MPKFDTVTEGFTSLKMIRRPNSNSSPAPNASRTPENTYPWDKAQTDVTTNMNEDFEYGTWSGFFFHPKCGEKMTIFLGLSFSFAGRVSVVAKRQRNANDDYYQDERRRGYYGYAVGVGIVAKVLTGKAM